MLDEIRRYTLASQWSLAELARRSGIAPGNLSRFARGQAGLSAKALDRLFRVLHLRIEADEPDYRPVDRLGRALKATGGKQRIHRPPQVRELVLQRLRDGDSPREIAVDLDIPRSTVNAWASKARRAGELE